MKAIALVMAAGRSERFGTDKLFLNLGGKPVWRWSFDAFLSHPEVSGVGLVVSPESQACFAQASPKALFVVRGGDSRQASVRAGLKAISAVDFDAVLVHDAARPLVSQALISRVLEAVHRVGAACPFLPVNDTAKLLSNEGLGEVIERERLALLQTPQGARLEDFCRAHEQVTVHATDDSSLLEAAGVRVAMVPGEPQNLKITTQADFQLIEAYLGPRETRTGFGYDVHRFSSDAGRPLMLGGVRFDGGRGLEGHSDADALTHAVVDSLLGAAGLGDIGEHFPNSDPRWKDQPSLFFLKHAAKLLAEHGWRVRHVDATVLAEAPKILPRRDEIATALAQAMEIAPSRVSIKATTHEGLGAIGRGEGIAAFAVATIEGEQQWKS